MPPATSPCASRRKASAIAPSPAATGVPASPPTPGRQVDRQRAEKRHAQRLRLGRHAAMAEQVRLVPAVRDRYRATCSRSGRAAASSACGTCRSPCARRAAPRPAGSRRRSRRSAGSAGRASAARPPCPGGRSTISTSSSPHATWVSICCSAPISIGPRQTTALSGSSIRPIDIIVTPCACSGMIVLPSGALRPLRHPHHARLRGTVDVGIQQADPPPLARQRHREVRGDGGLADPALARADGDDAVDARHRRGPACGVGMPADGQRRRLASSAPAGFAAGPCAVSTADTDCTPGSDLTAASAIWRSASMPRAASGDGASITKLTAPPSTVTARINIPRHGIAAVGKTDPAESLQNRLHGSRSCSIPLVFFASRWRLSGGADLAAALCQCSQTAKDPSS